MTIFLCRCGNSGTKPFGVRRQTPNGARWLRRYPPIAAPPRQAYSVADGLASDHADARRSRFGANVISTISNKGHLSFRCSTKFVAAVFIDFLGRLVRQSKGQKIILILDGHPVHRSKKVKK